MTRYAFSWLAPLAAALLALSPPAARADDRDGWRACADEGQSCRVQGRALVRYGDGERWVTRSIVGGIECGNAAFGDPAPDRPKRCEVRSDGPVDGKRDGRDKRADDWVFCAAEGEVCRFRGQSQVRFGQDRRFVTRSAWDGVRCDASEFGDPAYGVTKYCEVRRAQALPEGSRRDGWAAPPSSGGWRYCAAEGDTCRVNGRAQVRFGDGRRYNTRSANGEVACGVAAFGDPANGVLKHCEVQAAAADNGGWNRCAGEGERCDFGGRAQVRYGAEGRYVYRDAFDGLRCDTPSFGADPYGGRIKSCEVRR